VRADGVLLDIDGVLTISWEPIPGAIEAVDWLHEHGVPFCAITNTTTMTRHDLSDTLRGAGFDVTPDAIVTAVTATASYLAAEHAGASVFVLSDGEAADDLAGVRLVERPEDADVLVLGGAGEDFTYATINRIFRRLKDGASLVGMHRNLSWKTSRGWEIDGGAYVAALEEAAGVSAAICGKPAAPFFRAALGLLGVGADRAVMVGDDIVNDVLGAQALGITGVLVRTGKFSAADLAKGSPDVVLGALGALPGWLDGSD